MEFWRWTGLDEGSALGAKVVEEATKRGGVLPK
jgi:hypothetical protein